jgi:hypothetical protein
MSILFYDHLVHKQEIIIYIDTLSAPENHKSRLRQLVDDIIHQGIIEFLLQKLHPHQHHTFLTRVHDAPYDPEIISFLKDHTHPEIESEIEREANKLLVDIATDLKT